MLSPKFLPLTFQFAACVAAPFNAHPLKCGDCVCSPPSVHYRYPALAADVSKAAIWSRRSPERRRTAIRPPTGAGDRPQPRCTKKCIAAVAARAGRLPLLASPELLQSSL